MAFSCSQYTKRFLYGRFDTNRFAYWITDNFIQKDTCHLEPYIPDALPLKELDYAQIITLVGEANSKLAEYSGLLQGIVNPAVMLSPLTQQEAVLSSKIEGTQATVEEVLEREAGQKFDEDRKSTRLNSSHVRISYAVFCLKKKKKYKTKTVVAVLNITFICMSVDVQ